MVSEKEFRRTLEEIEETLKKREKELTKEDLQIILEEVREAKINAVAKNYKVVINEILEALNEQDTYTALYIIDEIEKLVVGENKKEKRKKLNEVNYIW